MELITVRELFKNTDRYAGAEIEIAASKQPVFKAGKAFKDAVAK